MLKPAMSISVDVKMFRHTLPSSTLAVMDFVVTGREMSETNIPSIVKLFMLPVPKARVPELLKAPHAYSRKVIVIVLLTLCSAEMQDRSICGWTTPVVAVDVSEIEDPMSMKLSPSRLYRQI